MMRIVVLLVELLVGACDRSVAKHKIIIIIPAIDYQT